MRILSLFAIGIAALSTAAAQDYQYQDADTSTYTIIDNSTSTDSTVTSTNNNTNTNTNTNVNTNTNTSSSTNSNTNTNTNNSTYTGTNTSTNTNSNTNNNTNNNTSTSTVSSTSNSTSNVTQDVTQENTNNNTNNNTSTSTSSSTSNSTVATDNKNENNNTNRNVNDTEIKSPPPSAIAPSIGSSYSQDLCTTGQSMAVQTQILGISGGKSVRDMNCERIKLSKTLYDMGMKVAAVSTMCQDERVWKAMMMAGTPCPFEGKIGTQAAAEWSRNPRLIPDNALDEVKIRRDQERDWSALRSIGSVLLLVLIL